MISFPKTTGIGAPTWWRRLSLVGVFAVGLMVALVLMPSRHVRVAPQSTPAAWLEPIGKQGAIPIPGGQATSLGSAVETVDFPILRPNDRLASDKSLSRVWVSKSGTEQVALEYTSGILVLVKRVEFDDPVAKYRAIQREFGSSYVTTIDRAPALVLTGNIRGRAPSIDMVIGGVNVQIQGRTGPFTVEDILRVARSIDQGNAR